MYTTEFAILFPSTSFIGSRLVHNRMSTDDLLRRRSCIVGLVCSLCYGAFESTYHLFVHLLSFCCSYLVMAPNQILDQP